MSEPTADPTNQHHDAVAAAPADEDLKVTEGILTAVSDGGPENKPVGDTNTAGAGEECPIAEHEDANKPATAEAAVANNDAEPAKEETTTTTGTKRTLEEDDAAAAGGDDASKRLKTEEEVPTATTESQDHDKTAHVLQEAAEAAAAVGVAEVKVEGGNIQEKGQSEGEGGVTVGEIPVAVAGGLVLKPDEEDGLPLVPPSKEGTSIFGDNDVLSGRGGGTNVHPGNRNFRDLINMHRRAYLKARKNDKPAISRAIVRAVRESNGRFLRKDEKTGLWFEIGDDAAREKTSQALRQRAPEMRKLLFDTEREEARVAAQEHMRQQRILLGMHPEMMGPNPNMPPGMMPGMPPPPGAPPGMMMNHPGMFAMAAGKNGMPMPPNLPPGANPEAYQQMFYGGGMNRFPGGSPPPQPPNAPPHQQLPPPPPQQQQPTPPPQQQQQLPVGETPVPTDGGGIVEVAATAEAVAAAAAAGGGGNIPAEATTPGSASNEIVNI